MDQTVKAKMHANIAQPSFNDSMGSDMDKYETSQGFGDIVQQQNRVNSIKVKQYIPPQPMRRRRDDGDTSQDFAKFEESAGDVTSTKDRVTIYDNND